MLEHERYIYILKCNKEITKVNLYTSLKSFMNVKIKINHLQIFYH